MKKRLISFILILLVACTVCLSFTACKEKEKYSVYFLVPDFWADHEETFGVPLSCLTQNLPGGSLVAVPDLEYAKSVLPDDPTISSGRYTFVAWYKDKEWNEEWDFEKDRTNKDTYTEIYAKYVRNSDLAS